MLKAINFAKPADQATYDYIKHSGTEAMLLWAPRWDKLEPERGQFDESQWTPVEEQIALAHSIGVKLYLTVDSTTPAWAYQEQIKGRRPPASRSWRMAPDDRTPDGPWAHYIGTILRRHPHVEGIVVINEPNAGFVDQPSMDRATAELMRAAAEVWRNEHATPMLMGPATFSGGGSLSFTYQVLHRLALHPLWHRHVNIAWAHHHYADVTAGVTTEVQKILGALQHHWPAGDEVWLTEGGYVYRTHQDPNPDYHADPATWHYNDPLEEQERLQAERVGAHYEWCKKNGRVRMWANYECVDSLWGGWASGLFRHDGTPHPLATIWPHL